MILAVLAPFVGGAVVGAMWAYVAMDDAHEQTALDTYRSWLGRTCWAKLGGRWVRCSCVAVSWRGGVCVRDEGRTDGHGGRWISAVDVPFRVRWEANE